MIIMTKSSEIIEGARLEGEAWREQFALLADEALDNEVYSRNWDFHRGCGMSTMAAHHAAELDVIWAGDRVRENNYDGLQAAFQRA